MGLSVWLWLVLAKKREKALRQKLREKEQAEKEELARQQERRRKELLDKYGDEELVSRILDQVIWEGEPAEILLESLGPPVERDQQVLKTKTKETWKYYPVARRRYALKIHLENGIVYGWDQKGI